MTIKLYQLLLLITKSPYHSNFKTPLHICSQNNVNHAPHTLILRCYFRIVHASHKERMFMLRDRTM